MTVQKKMKHLLSKKRLNDHFRVVTITLATVCLGVQQADSLPAKKPCS